MRKMRCYKSVVSAVRFSDFIAFLLRSKIRLEKSK